MADLAVGLMSGTSCDGVSAALASFQGKRLRVLGYRTDPYPALLARLLKQSHLLSPSRLSSLNMALGEQFAQTALRLIKTCRIPKERISVIGSHGHTVYHGPRDGTPSTLQIGEPAVIAERTGLSVISNFRPRDIAAGGEGAPLIPFFDWFFFGGGKTKTLQNIGGIANVTVVGRNTRPIAFDTGPGNCLMDHAAFLASRGRLAYDPGGKMAASGRIDFKAVKKLWLNAYFRKKPPKSTGRELFNEALLRGVFGKRLKSRPADVLATVTYFTAYSIIESYRRFITQSIHEIIVSGGGAKNQTLMRHLAALASPIPVCSIERYGIAAQAKEPVAFGFLALRAINNQVNHLPQTTGAKAARILGSLTQGNR